MFLSVGRKLDLDLANRLTIKANGYARARPLKHCARSLQIYFIFQFSEFSLMLQLLSNVFVLALSHSLSLKVVASLIASVSYVCRRRFVKYRYRFQAVCGYFCPLHLAPTNSFLCELFFLSLLLHFTIFAYRGCHKLLNKMNDRFLSVCVCVPLRSLTLLNKNI